MKFSLTHTFTSSPAISICAQNEAARVLLEERGKIDVNEEISLIKKVVVIALTQYFYICIYSFIAVVAD